MRLIYAALLTLMWCHPLVAQNISGVVNTYRKVLWIDSASGRAKLSDVSGFAGLNGRKVLLIQMKGATISGGANINDAGFGDITSIGSAGFYEVATICGFLNDTVVFERKLNNFYDVAGKVQCIIIPSYNNVTVTDTVKAASWDPVADTGGVVVMEVSGTLFLNKPITASGMGFRGGTYTQFGGTCNVNPLIPPTDFYMPFAANALKTAGRKGEGIAEFLSGKEYARGKQASGGGGGNNHNAGGGGGSNYGAGGAGGNRVTSTIGQCASNGLAQGGVALSSFGYALSPASQNRLFMGGGGGAGHDNDGFGLPGGNGGGIIFIMANRIEGISATPSDNSILANGAVPGRFLPAPLSFFSDASSSDGAGGGGAGGAIVLLVNSFGGNGVQIQVKGGRGGNSEVGNNTQCSGPGGGGGGGLIYFSGIPGGLSITLSGGAKGVTTSGLPACNGQSNGATDGGNGAFSIGFQLAAPRDSSPVCKGLVALEWYTTIQGITTDEQYRILFTIDPLARPNTCILQSAGADGRFVDVYGLPYTPGGQYLFTDPAFNGSSTLYRVKVRLPDGSVQYSAILRRQATTRSGQPLVLLFPNPAKQTLTARLDLPQTGFAIMEIIDAGGRVIWVQRQVLGRGINYVPIALTALPEGYLLFRLTTGKSSVTRPFIRLLQ
jgi:hypothetical protein